MQYSDIQTLFYNLTKTNSSSMPAATLNSFTQPAERKVNDLLMKSDGRWQFDDSNYADLPIAIGDLVYNQQDYSLPTTHLRVSGVAVLTNANIWMRLLPFDPEDLKDHFAPQIDRAQFFATAGRPLFYDKQGQSILLYPKPDNGTSVTLTGGLKIYFERGPLVFDWTTSKFTDGTGSTSSEPGFNSNFHDLIAWEAAYPYVLMNIPSLAAGYLQEVTRKEEALKLAYEQRDQDERNNITTAPIRYK